MRYFLHTLYCVMVVTVVTLAFLAAGTFLLHLIYEVMP